MNPHEQLAATVRAEALGVKPNDPLTLTARLDECERQIAALKMQALELYRIIGEQNAEFAAEVAPQRREPGLAA